jgi:hypothetical protein
VLLLLLLFLFLLLLLLLLHCIHKCDGITAKYLLFCIAYSEILLKAHYCLMII